MTRIHTHRLINEVTRQVLSRFTSLSQAEAHIADIALTVAGIKGWTMSRDGDDPRFTLTDNLGNVNVYLLEEVK